MDTEIPQTEQEEIPVEEAEDQEASESAQASTATPSAETTSTGALETAPGAPVVNEKKVMIYAEGLSKYFKSIGETVKAVNNVSFTFTEGQFITIMGPSGCGKSTLLYILGGLDKATSGELVVDGVDVRRLSPRQEHLFRRQKLGFVFQSFHLIPNLSALENVILPMQLAGHQSHRAMAEKAKGLLIQVGINEDRHNHKPGKLSGGQKQRVAIARALANDPKIILADEPTGNLDSKNGKLIIQLLKTLSEQGRTVLVVTHDIGVANIADVRMRLDDGMIEAMENYTTPVRNVPQTRKKKRRA
jgi:ABC-type lipoprotein export system ATPase subunit